MPESPPAGAEPAIRRHVETPVFDSVATLDDLLEARGLALVQLQAAENQIPSVPPLWLEAPPPIVQAHTAVGQSEGVTLASLSNILVSGPSLIGSEQAVFALGGPLMPRYLAVYLKNGWIEGATELLAPKSVRRIEGLSVLLTHFNSGVYGHWLLEGLPKLMLLRRLAPSLPPVSIVLPSSAPPFVRAWCQFLTPEIPIVTYKDAVEFICCEKLLVPGLLHSQDYVFHSLLGALIKETVEAASRSTAAGFAETAPQSIYLSRVEPSPYRRLENRDEIEAIARSTGLAVVSPEALTIPDQVQLFAGAEFIAGEFGSSLHNTIFSGPTTVLALNWINSCQSRVAQSRMQRLAYLLPEGGPLTFDRNLLGVQRRYTIDPRAFASAIHLAVRLKCIV